MVHMWRSTLDSRRLLNSLRRILILLLVQVPFSGVRASAGPFHVPMPIRLLICGPRCFSGIEPGNGQSQVSGCSAHLWPASESAEGVGIGGIIGLLGIQPDLPQRRTLEESHF